MYVFPPPPNTAKVGDNNWLNVANQAIRKICFFLKILVIVVDNNGYSVTVKK